MADNLQSAGPQDRARINMNEDWEVQYWTKELGVSKEELREAIKAVGPMAADVRARLGRR